MSQKLSKSAINLQNKLFTGGGTSMETVETVAF